MVLHVQKQERFYHILSVAYIDKKLIIVCMNEASQLQMGLETRIVN